MAKSDQSVTSVLITPATANLVAVFWRAISVDDIMTEPGEDDDYLRADSEVAPAYCLL